MKTGSAPKAGGKGSTWLSFDAARAFVRALQLGSAKEWKEYRKSGKRPSNIPSGPDSIYRDSGWVSMPDWLGYKEKGTTKGGTLPFEDARAIARALKLGSVKEWKEYSKSDKRPSNIPGNPPVTYRDDGWVSWPDWLGYAKKMMTKGGALPFEEARAFGRALKLGGEKEWYEYRKSDESPSNIPGNPAKVYRDDGWISWPDWLGYGGQSGGANYSCSVARQLRLEAFQRDVARGGALTDTERASAAAAGVTFHLHGHLFPCAQEIYTRLQRIKIADDAPRDIVIESIESLDITTANEYCCLFMLNSEGHTPVALRLFITDEPDAAIFDLDRGSDGDGASSSASSSSASSSSSSASSSSSPRKKRARGGDDEGDGSSDGDGASSSATSSSPSSSSTSKLPPPVRALSENRTRALPSEGGAHEGGEWPGEGGGGAMHTWKKQRVTKLKRLRKHGTVDDEDDDEEGDLTDSTVNGHRSAKLFRDADADDGDGGATDDEVGAKRRRKTKASPVEPVVSEYELGRRAKIKGNNKFLVSGRLLFPPMDALEDDEHPWWYKTAH
jgi:hypothetical protein